MDLTEAEDIKKTWQEYTEELYKKDIFPKHFRQIKGPRIVSPKAVLLTLPCSMAPHSSTLAWKIPWTEEPGGLQSMGLLRVGHD